MSGIFDSDFNEAKNRADQDFIDKIAFYTQVKLSPETITAVKEAGDIWQEQMKWGLAPDWEERITALFERVPDHELTAMERCTHQNTPYGHIIRTVMFERLLLGKNKV